MIEDIWRLHKKNQKYEGLVVFQLKGMNGLCSDIEKLKVEKAALQKDLDKQEKIITTLESRGGHNKVLSELWVSAEWE